MYKSLEIQITKQHRHWAKCDEMCFYAKNIYNTTCWVIRDHATSTGEFPNQKEIYGRVTKAECWKESGHRQIPLQVMRNTNQMWKSYFAALKAYRKNPGKFKGYPKHPGYKHKDNGRFKCTFINLNTGSSISKPNLKSGRIKLLGNCGIEFAIPDHIRESRICTVDIIPRGDCYSIVVNYYTPDLEVEKLPVDRIAAIDLGLNNLMAIADNSGGTPQLVNGRPIKSINQFYNKEVARLRSQLPEGIRFSRAIRRITRKRNNKINDYVHNVTKRVADYLVVNNIGTLIIGNNQGWKQKINIGRRNNQNFVSIPYHKIINQLERKFKEKGGHTIIREESYTSKSSFLDQDSIPTYQPWEDGAKPHHKFSGRRIKRGLYKAGDGTLINADVNAAFNILRKEFPKAFVDGIEGTAVCPAKMRIFANLHNVSYCD